MKLGEQGEQIAVDYLTKKKFKILARNYETSYGEIDIIASWKKQIHFIEVKTRRSTNFGSPEEAVTVQKQQKIRNVAQVFLGEDRAKRLSKYEIFLDVIAIKINEYDELYNVQHFVGAF